LGGRPLTNRESGGRPFQKAEESATEVTATVAETTIFYRRTEILARHLKRTEAAHDSPYEHAGPMVVHLKNRPATIGKADDPAHADHAIFDSPEEIDATHGHPLVGLELAEPNLRARTRGLIRRREAAAIPGLPALVDQGRRENHDDNAGRQNDRESTHSASYSKTLPKN